MREGFKDGFRDDSDDGDEDDDDHDDGHGDRIHLEKVLHSEPTSMTRSPTTRPHSEQI